MKTSFIIIVLTIIFLSLLSVYSIKADREIECIDNCLLKYKLDLKEMCIRDCVR